MRKSKLCLIAISAFSLIVCSGCERNLFWGKDGQNEELKVVEGSKEGVCLRYVLWGDDEEESHVNSMVAEFEELYPYIQVEVEVISYNYYKNNFEAYLSGEKQADILEITYPWLEKYSEDGEAFYNLEKLSDYIDLTQYDEAEISYGMQVGKLNALPISMETTCFIYNASILDEYGLSVPKTWNDLFKMAKVLNKAGIYLFTTEKEELVTLLFAYVEQTTGKRAFDGDGRLQFKEDDFALMLDLYNRLIEEKVLCPLSSNSEALMRMGKIVGAITNTNKTEEYNRFILDADGTSSIGPLLSTGKNLILGYYMNPYPMLAIAAKSSHPVETAILMNYLLNDENKILKEGNYHGVPVSNSAQIALLETGKMDTISYRASMQMNCYKSELKEKNSLLMDEKTVDRAFEILEGYYKCMNAKEISANFLYQNYSD